LFTLWKKAVESWLQSAQVTVEGRAAALLKAHPPGQAKNAEAT
jgi:hypothetical protein